MVDLYDENIRYNMSMDKGMHPCVLIGWIDTEACVCLDPGWEYGRTKKKKEILRCQR